MERPPLLFAVTFVEPNLLSSFVPNCWLMTFMVEGGEPSYKMALITIPCHGFEIIFY
jgi:hypothetical protein